MAEQKIDLEELKRQLKAELKEEAAQEAAEKEAAAAAAKNAEQKAAEDYLNELVTVRLFKDGKNYKDDVFVAINGENCVIKRGVPVQIKRKFALVLDQQEAQDVAAAKYSEQMQNEYNEAVIRYNI